MPIFLRRKDRIPGDRLAPFLHLELLGECDEVICPRANRSKQSILLTALRGWIYGASQ